MMILGGIICIGVSGYIFTFVGKSQTLPERD